MFSSDKDVSRFLDAIFASIPKDRYSSEAGAVAADRAMQGSEGRSDAGLGYEEPKATAAATAQIQNAYHRMHSADIKRAKDRPIAPSERLRSDASKGSKSSRTSPVEKIVTKQTKKDSFLDTILRKRK